MTPSRRTRPRRISRRRFPSGRSRPVRFETLEPRRLLAIQVTTANFELKGQLTYELPASRYAGAVHPLPIAGAKVSVSFDAVPTVNQTNTTTFTYYGTTDNDGNYTITIPTEADIENAALTATAADPAATFTVWAVGANAANGQPAYEVVSPNMSPYSYSTGLGGQNGDGTQN